jgi:hypothetical protein
LIFPEIVNMRYFTSYLLRGRISDTEQGAGMVNLEQPAIPGKGRHRAGKKG